MNRITRAIVVGMFLALTVMAGLSRGSIVSAQDATPAAGTPCPTTTPDQNTALVLGFVNAQQSSDTDMAGAMATMQADLAPTVTDSELPNLDPALTGGVKLGSSISSSSLIQLDLASASYFDDFSYTIENTVASGDTVVVRYIFTVNKQHFPGATPGATASVDYFLMARVSCGKIVEMDDIGDFISLFRQLGLPAIPLNMPATATPAA